MRNFLNSSFLLLLTLTSVPAYPANVIDPVSFEQIWLQNNQRNLIRRYYAQNAQIQQGAQEIWFAGVDGARNRTIATTSGEVEALISRLNIHYQTSKYLMLVDWFSAIPQPQETEGFYYGDMLIARSWRHLQDDAYLTLGIRQKSTPRTKVQNSQVLFDSGTDATEQEYSLFVHLNYQGWDLGSYFSEDNRLDATALYVPITERRHRRTSSVVYYYGSQPRVNQKEKLELSILHDVSRYQHNLHAGLSLALHPSDGKTAVSNFNLRYMSPKRYGLSLVAGAFYNYDLDLEQHLPGAKLGIVLQLDMPEKMQLGFSVQKNAIGDYEAMVIPDEPIYSFTLSTMSESP